MHEDLIYIGPYPCDEDGAQTVDADYARNAKVECRAFIEAIRKVCGREPEGARLTVKADRYDDGNMLYEVVVQFDGRNQKAAEYAFHCEANAPATWADAGMEAPKLGAGLRR